MTLSLDTLSSTAIVDSVGTVLDTASLVVNNDSSITVTSNASNLSWAFDADLINAFGQPVLDSLRVLFTGEQRFQYICSRKMKQFSISTPLFLFSSAFSANMELATQNIGRNRKPQPHSD